MTQVGTWQPHQRRGSIAAEYSSPGPAYGLPGIVGQKQHDPRSVHKKGPAWHFGVRAGKFQDDCSPGPAYNPNNSYTRVGPNGAPHYSLQGRNRDLQSFNTPGPGAYSPEKVGPSAYYMPPKYSLGGRLKQRGTDGTPGPNVYSLPGMLGKTVQSSKKQAANFSLTSRSKIGGFHEDLQKTPGPGAYSLTSPDLYKDKKPAYSVTGRSEMPGDTTQKPGPGAHSVDNIYATKKALPSYSFGVRHTPYCAPLIVDVVD